MVNLVSSPHHHGALQTNQLMLHVMLACVPALFVQIYAFGWGNLIHVLLAVITALLCEAAVVKLRKRSVFFTLTDYSAALTGLLIGLSIPGIAPWWMSVIGTGFAIVIVKQLYGGLGFNIFNPAMAGYVVLLVSFPVQMSQWMPSAELAAHQTSFVDALTLVFSGVSSSGLTPEQLRLGVDGITQATPLDAMKTGLTQGQTLFEVAQRFAIDDWEKNAWVWLNLAYLLGGLYLLKMRAIRWHIPAGVLLGLGAISLFFFLYDSSTHASPLMHWLSGATMMGAFIIATDPVSASTTNKGRLIYGAMIGLLVYIIRQWGGYPDAMAFAVLLANMTVPLLDQYTKPHVYGHGD